MILDRIGTKSRDLNLLFMANFLAGLLFFLPTIALYMEQELFSLQNVALIFAVRSIFTVILEVPSGAFSDLFGRAMTIKMAFGIYIVALIFVWMGGSMVNFLIYAFLWAIATSLESGNDSSYVYDTLKDVGRERNFKRLMGRYYVMWTSGAAIGSLVGGYMVSESFRFPILMALIPVTMSFVLTCFLREPKFQKEDDKNIIRHMIASAKVAFKSRNILILLFAGFLLVGFGEVLFMMDAIFFRFKDIPIHYFGYISALSFVFSSLGFYTSHKISEFLGNKVTLSLSVLFGGVAVLTATYLLGIWAAVPAVVGAFFFGLRWPVIDDIANAEIVSSKRATIMSLLSFVRHLGVAIISPFLGYLADLYTINTAFRLSGCVTIVVTILFLFLRIKKSLDDRKVLPLDLVPPAHVRS